MSADILESDWKIFRAIHRPALERFCERILSEVRELVNDTSKGSHERYLLAIRLLKKRDDEIALVFDDFRRSTAIRQLAIMYSRGFLTNEEFARFSLETQEHMTSLGEIFRPKKKKGRN